MTRSMFPEDIGGNILFYDGVSPEKIPSLSLRRRFLNVLWLPCALGNLSEDQIAIISRFREQHIERDEQFGHAKFARNAMVTLLRMLKIARVLEVGCGKFPIVRDEHFDRYRGIEIDPMAIKFCKEKDLEVGTVSEFHGDDGVMFDAAIAIYAFHFAISGQLIGLIDRSLAPGGCVIFNAIVDDSVHFVTTLASLSSAFKVSEIIKTPQLAKREFFVVMGRLNDFNSVPAVSQTLKGLL